jgi:hypothetical protein
MKTQVLQLEHFDDVASVCDKIHWSKSPRVLLVWPVGKKELLSRLDLVVIYREGIKTGVQIALVSRNAEVKRNARNLDIPVFATVIRAQRAPWRRSRKIWHPIRSTGTRDGLTRESLESRRQSISTGLQPLAIRLTFFSLGILAVIALVFLFLPSATITLQMSSQEQQLDLQLTADPNVQTANLSLEIPAQSTSIIVEGKQEKASSGSTAVPDKTAGGSVQFINLTSQDIEIPIGTFVSTASTPPIRFRTLESVTIPALATESDEVAIEAVVPGVEGNLPTGEIQVIENELGTLASVSNPEPTTGGTQIDFPSPTTMDYDNLRKDLMISLQEQAAELMKASIPAEAVLVPETLNMDKILEEKYSPEVGSPGDNVTLSMHAQYTAFYIRLSDSVAAAKIALDAALPQGFSAKEDDIEILPLQEPVYEHNKITWQVSVARRIYKDYEEQQIVRQIAGEKVQSAANTLKQEFDLEQDPAIQVFPAWWPLLPFAAFRIGVIEQ